jgi:FKBP-type peptidyl-prolyl cis-trans isomerase FkpA
MMKILVFLLITTLLLSCKTYSEEDKKNFDKEITTFLKEKEIDCQRSNSGLYFKILSEGEGKKIQYSDNVTFTYKGKLLNGTVFDNQKKPISFAVKDLIAGWKEIILKLKPGGKAYMVIPPSLGYGEHDLEKIPPNSILTFEMEIASAQ